MVLRWLKTRQLVEVVPPGLQGREGDAWTVRLSATDGSGGGGVRDLHKLLVEDDPRHAASFVWSVALRGYVSMLEGSSGTLVGHGDALPPAAISTPPPRGSVAVEHVKGGAAWLMEALQRRDTQIESLAGRLHEAEAKIAELEARCPPRTPAPPPHTATSSSTAAASAPTDAPPPLPPGGGAGGGDESSAGAARAAAARQGPGGGRGLGGGARGGAGRR